MTCSQKIAFSSLILLLVVGTILYWFIPWANTDLQNNATSYVVFLATLVGFVATVYQLGETERSIQESIQKPALRLEVLPSAGSLGLYNNLKVNKLTLHPEKGDTVLGARCALRIENNGNKAASKIYLTFILCRKGKSEDDAISRVTVGYDKDKQNYIKPTYYDGDIRGGHQVGCTFRFSEDFVIYADPYDRPVVAELKLTMKASDFEPDYEIHYRIHSYEGNKHLDEAKDKKTGKPLNQVYPITFERAARPMKTL